MSINFNNPPNLAAPVCPAGSASYTIKSGDTFYVLAQRLGTSVVAIIALNPGVNPNALQIGQQICVPAAVPNPGTCPGGIVYTIRAGDTFYVLAARYGVSLQAFLAANPGIDPNRLMVGEMICIPGAVSPTPDLIPTPFCSLLQPIFTAIPPAADIPIGSVTVRQVAMSTRAYTMAVSPLPEPGSLGNFNSYVGVLNLITGDPSMPRRTVNMRLMPSSFGNQLATWAGTIITTEPPIVGDFAEVRPFNSNTGNQGEALLGGNFSLCNS